LRSAVGTAAWCSSQGSISPAAFSRGSR